MRILHVVQSLDPAWGGIARVLPLLASELAAAGETCCIATLQGGRFGMAPDVPGVTVLTFEPSRGTRLGRSRAFAAAIDGLVRESDVVHLHGLWTGQNWAAGKAARRLGKPYIMTPHSMMMPWAWQRSAWKKRPAGWLFEHGNLRQAACLHALAEGEAQAMRALGFNERIEIIPNGLHVREYDQLPRPDALISRFPVLRDGRWIVCLGRIHPQKSIDLVVQACCDVFEEIDDWRLLVAGPDEIGLRSNLKQLAEARGMKDRIVFAGMLGRDDVLSCLAGAALLLQPSRSEGLSMSILEAMACGVPVLISHACNMPEVEQQRAGRVIYPTLLDLRVALREMLRWPDAVRREMGQRGRAIITERFDWPKLIPAYRAMYAKAAASRR